MHKWTNPFFFLIKATVALPFSSREKISRTMVISNFYQKPCFTCLSGADPHSFHCFTEIGQIFHNRLLSCKASSEKKELAKLSCLNDSETQERGLWEVKIEKNFLLGHAPGPHKSLRLRRSFRKSVSINPRSAPASRFCSCFIIRRLKQRRFWVMHFNRKWILYPFQMPWSWYQICIL